VTFDELVARLDARKSGTGWAARCPAHDDRKPSLTISAGDDGRILLHCQAGCDLDAVLAALGLTVKDLFPPKQKTAGRAGIVATYDYVDEAGVLLFQVVRYDNKTFKQRQPDKTQASGWAWNLKGVRRVLYRLPEVVEAVAAGRTVFVVEGEKDVDALRAAGEVATCNPMGAGKWTAAHAATLKGAVEVVVVADTDLAGKEHAHDVATSLAGKVGHLLVVHAATGKDAADHLGAGRGVDEFTVIYDSDQPPAAPNAGDLAELLDEVVVLIVRYVAFPVPEACTAVALWAAHCHVVNAFESTPRLVLISPEKQSGKTRTLEVLEVITPNPRHGVNLTAAALFRAVAVEQPTLLFDEADTFFGSRASEHEELRGLVNAGHRKGAMAYRCVGDPKNMEVRAFPAFCAVALAAIGDLPDTIIDRAVVIKMRRRAPNETVQPFRQRVASKEGTVLRDRLAAWAAQAADTLADAWPAIPEGLADRASDVWEPLLAIADMAGGDWPVRAREAALKLNDDRMAADVSLGLRLLSDLRNLIVVEQKTDRLFTDTILDHLNGLEESPWGNLRGKPLDSRGLARRLKRYDVIPKQIRIGDETKKGYTLDDLADAFARYLPPLPTPEEGNKRNMGNSGEF
jgi:5S rRNA maturation endonuclease (ribonuclease M5)